MIVPLITRALSPPKSGKHGAEGSHSDLHTAVAIFLNGLLLTLCVILRFPELGAVIAQYNQF